MSMTTYEALAERMDQHVELLLSRGSDLTSIFNQMTGYLPQFDELWRNTSDQQLASLFKRFPHFESLCEHMEKLFHQESSRPNKAYQGVEPLNESQKLMVSRVLSAGTEFERYLLNVIASATQPDPASLNEFKEALSQWRLSTLNVINLNDYSIQTIKTTFNQIANRIQYQIRQLEFTDS